MADLSELVKRDYDAEVGIIREAGGRLWPKWLALAIGVFIMWFLGELFGDTWTKRDVAEMIIFVIAAPFAGKIWEQFKVAMQMRHQREVRIEAKLDALLGLLKIEG